LAGRHHTVGARCVDCNVGGRSSELDFGTGYKASGVPKEKPGDK